MECSQLIRSCMWAASSRQGVTSTCHNSANPALKCGPSTPQLWLAVSLPQANQSTWWLPHHRLSSFTDPNMTGCGLESPPPPTDSMDSHQTASRPSILSSSPLHRICWHVLWPTIGIILEIPGWLPPVHPNQLHSSPPPTGFLLLLAVPSHVTHGWSP